MRHGIQALAVLLFFLATLTIFSGRPRATGFLAARVAALEAELNKLPVVIDANGDEVGAVLSLESNDVRIFGDFEEIPLFLLRINYVGTEMQGSTQPLLFLSTDCSGTPFLPSSDVPTVFAPSFFNTVTGEVYVGDQSVERVRIQLVSRLQADENCEVSPRTAWVTPAIAVPGVAFVTPFEVVTRGDLLAE